MFGFNLMDLIISIPAVLLCIGFHEAAHGYAAYWLGDPTAKYNGRLSLNPLSHVDPIGFLCLLLFRFGWAKPVPVNSGYFKHPKRDIALVSAAGPIANILLAAVMLMLIRILNFLPNPFTMALSIFFNITAIMSIGLAVFNLLPVPPLDGSKIFYPILPSKWIYFMQEYQMYIQFGLIAMLYFGLFRAPFNIATNFIYSTLASLIFM